MAELGCHTSISKPSSPAQTNKGHELLGLLTVWGTKRVGEGRNKVTDPLAFRQIAWLPLWLIEIKTCLQFCAQFCRGRCRAWLHCNCLNVTIISSTSAGTLLAASAKGREQWEQPLPHLSHGLTLGEAGSCSEANQHRAGQCKGKWCFCCICYIILSTLLQVMRSEVSHHDCCLIVPSTDHQHKAPPGRCHPCFHIQIPSAAGR